MHKGTHTYLLVTTPLCHSQLDGLQFALADDGHTAGAGDPGGRRHLPQHPGEDLVPAQRLFVTFLPVHYGLVQQWVKVHGPARKGRGRGDRDRHKNSKEVKKKRKQKSIVPLEYKYVRNFNVLKDIH